MLMQSTVRNQAEIERRIAELERKLAPDAVRIRYTFTQDSVGDEAIFFRIVLSNAAAREKRLRASTNRIENELMEAIPYDEFGLQLHFRYRSRSEQAAMKEPAWS